MKKQLLFFLLCTCIILLFSCSTNETISCHLPDNVAISNSPLVPGASLNLKATSTHNIDVSYNWSGPNNFQSNLQNPVITDITPTMAGEYKIKTIKGICESSESSVFVEINAPNIPCVPKTNTMILNGDLLNPLKLSTSTTNYNQNFKILAGNLRTSVIIEFASEERPTPGIYRICSDCPTSFMDKDQVCVSFNYAELCHAREGLVYLSSSNGKLSATFCDVVFKPSVFTINTSANLTEN